MPTDGKRWIWTPTRQLVLTAVKIVAKAATARARPTAPARSAGATDPGWNASSWSNGSSASPPARRSSHSASCTGGPAPLAVPGAMEAVCHSQVGIQASEMR